MTTKLLPCPICGAEPYMETMSVCPLHWEGIIYCPNRDCEYESDTDWMAD